MPDLTIPNVSKNLQQQLSRRAVRQGRSAEAEVLEILRAAVKDEPKAVKDQSKKRREPEKGLGTAIHERVMKHGGYDLEPPVRDRTPPRFPPPISGK